MKSPIRTGGRWTPARRTAVAGALLLLGVSAGIRTSLNVLDLVQGFSSVRNLQNQLALLEEDLESRGEDGYKPAPSARPEPDPLNMLLSGSSSSTSPVEVLPLSLRREELDGRSVLLVRLEVAGEFNRVARTLQTWEREAGLLVTNLSISFGGAGETRWTAGGIVDLP